MKIVFENEDLKQLLIDHATKQGFTFNHVSWDCSYGYVKSATVSFVKPEPEVEDDTNH